MGAFFGYCLFVILLLGILQWGIGGIVLAIIVIVICVVVRSQGKKAQIQKEINVYKQISSDEWDIANLRIEDHEEYLQKHGGEK